MHFLPMGTNVCWQVHILSQLGMGRIMAWGVRVLGGLEVERPGCPGSLGGGARLRGAVCCPLQAALMVNVMAAFLGLHELTTNLYWAPPIGQDLGRS